MRKAVVPTSASTPANRDNAPKLRSWMLVDDDEAPLQFLANSLQVFDLADVHSFRNPADALNAFKAAPRAFELVITDLNMPGMTGIQLCQRLLQISPSVKVILTSADLIDTQRIATETGCCAFLSKPFPPGALWRTLEQVLGQIAAPRPRKVFDLQL